MVANFEELNNAQLNQQLDHKLNHSDLKTLQLINSNKDTLKMDDLVLLLYGHSAFQNLYAGCELGVFELLWKHPDLTQTEIAQHLQLEAYPTKALLLGLTALKLIQKVGDKYRNSLVIQMLFLENTWKEFYDTVLFEAKIVYRGSIDYVESLQQNRNVGLRQFQGQGPDLYNRLHEDPGLDKVFYNFMGSWSKLVTPLWLKKIDFSNFQSVVDVGGGDATNSIALAEAFPNVKITLMDIPDSCKIAQSRIDQKQLTDRIQVVGGDIFVDEFPNNQDCFLFIHVLVIWSLDKNTTLLRRAYQALKPGGSLIIFNMMTSDEEDGPLMAALDSSYFVSIPHEGGMIYSWRDHEQCLRDAGFTQMKRIYSDFWAPSGIIVATK
ncbi:methyltransferase domain-containing protein [Cylindrospermopsis raciborskii CS-506_D]|uniref:Methyltransferase domain-containing protein n=1 Tax=Cylindrospermopsis raciborskii CS-506_A TaxID=2585140 RepID=A0A838WQY8_9CYAN|nr:MULTISPECIES: methyltransferase [Aphanizomenonaceae]MBA4446884.1 methyltransferase domain-containing protein [Cylindrospermopsis raciborskii CS-506_C]MBA4451122.1 methyltransferase domain-containing protein [Cylindrospermopsis raciborskii CS-506_D]MBA4457726.1 methyltransferase domain-containing protein [Cylindrospermopsis raciborskii CS-506_B]MBA4467095.1 methyltransferase domain-containing protein [Cylindrospermopsis raciborskii CS-506_A]MDB9310435.1 methyltransferase [Aphanizomenon sp. C